MNNNTLLAVLSVLPALYILKRLMQGFRSGQPSLPPGPKGLPIIGNVFDWPTKTWRPESLKWIHLYGDMVHFDFAGTHLLIVNTVEAANSIMHGKGANYSDRPFMPFMRDLVGWGSTTVMSNDGPEFREHRRLFANALGTKASLKRFDSMVEGHTKQFLRRLMDNTEGTKVLNHVRRLIGTIILDMTYGYEVKDDRSEFVALAELVLDDFVRNGTPGTNIMDTFPSIAKLPPWLPGVNGLYATAAVMRKSWLRFANEPLELVRSQMAAGTARPSFIREHMEDKVLTPFQEEAIRWTAASIYAAGTDTTVAMTYSGLYHLMNNPDIQKKARAEIDAVIGRDRLPNIADRSNLPYFEAVCKEVVRCTHIADQSLPHRSRADDIHEGYFVPKNTLVIPNLWLMGHDPRKYKNGDKFDPTRFLGDAPEADPRDYAFGFGRRICPGRFFADNNVYLTLVSFLATFEIFKPLDAQGKEYIPELHYKHQYAAIPDPFPCVIKIRGPEAASLIESEAAEAA